MILIVFSSIKHYTLENIQENLLRKLPLYEEFEALATMAGFKVLALYEDYRLLHFKKSRSCAWSAPPAMKKYFQERRVLL
jgi:hypothetical protein